jgi:hypothetical protein
MANYLPHFAEAWSRHKLLADQNVLLNTITNSHNFNFTNIVLPRQCLNLRKYARHPGATQIMRRWNLLGRKQKKREKEEDLGTNCCLLQLPKFRCDNFESQGKEPCSAPPTPLNLHMRAWHLTIIFCSTIPSTGGYCISGIFF